MPPNHSNTTEIFIAYAPQDTAIREELEKHLSNLNIQTHHDGKIEAGKVTDKTVEEYLQKANIILLLISSDFLSNDETYDVQLTQAIERHQNGEARVIPIICRYCFWKNSPFADLQPLPSKLNKEGKIIPIVNDESVSMDYQLSEIAASIYDLLNPIEEEQKQTSEKDLETGSFLEEMEIEVLAAPLPPIKSEEIQEEEEEQEEEDRKNNLRSLLYLRCDRKQQSEEFTDCIEQRISPDFNQPFFYLIHGAFEEQHFNLVKRFKEFKIYDLAEQVISETKGVVDFYTIKEFPVSKDLDFRKRQLKRKIAEEIDKLNGANWTAKDLLELYQNRPAGGVILLQHNISCDTWDAQTLQLLQWYIRDFWKVQIEQENLYVIVFLNIIYPEKKGGFLKRLFRPNKSEKVQEQLTKLASELQNHCNLLAVLEPVTVEDVRIWIRDFELHEMKNLADKLFAEKDKVPMELIEATFKKPIEDLRREDGQAAIRGL